MGEFWYLQSRVTRPSRIEEEKFYIPAERQAAHGWAWQVLPEVWLEKAAAALSLSVMLEQARVELHSFT
jgi:hypothetical protein